MKQYVHTYMQIWIMHKRQKMGSYACKFIILIFIYSYQFWSVVCMVKRDNMVSMYCLQNEFEEPFSISQLDHSNFV